MILAAGLTPAWQQILVFDRFQAGEVNRAREAHWCASGKVVNVGVGLTTLGASCRMLSITGSGAGDLLRRDATKLGVPARWIETAAPTRVCTTILDRATGVTTELVENALPLDAAEVERYVAAYAEEVRAATVCVLSGSLPPGAPPTFYRDLLERTPAGTRVVVDARGPELVEALPRNPFLVKPNREELAKTAGRMLTSDDEVIAAMHELNRRGAAWVVVSHGAKTVLATSAGSQHRFEPPRVPVVNPIGCGDSMAAGIAAALAAGLDVPDAIGCGMAAAADNVSQLLPARLSAERVAALAARCS